VVANSRIGASKDAECDCTFNVVLLFDMDICLCKEYFLINPANPFRAAVSSQVQKMEVALLKNFLLFFSLYKITPEYGLHLFQEDSDDPGDDDNDDPVLAKRLNKQRRRAIAAARGGRRALGSRNSYKDKGGKASHNSKVQRQACKW